MVADRLIRWGGNGYGSAVDAGAAAPSTTWYLAEGSTGLFQLYYLLLNPGLQPATVTVKYLREGAGPITKTYAVPAQSRASVFVNLADLGLLVVVGRRAHHVDPADRRRARDVLQRQSGVRCGHGRDGLAAARDAVAVRGEQHRSVLRRVRLAVESVDDADRDGDADVPSAGRQHADAQLHGLARAAPHGVSESRGAARSRPRRAAEHDVLDDGRFQHPDRHRARDVVAARHALV